MQVFDLQHRQVRRTMKPPVPANGSSGALLCLDKEKGQTLGGRVCPKRMIGQAALSIGLVAGSHRSASVDPFQPTSPSLLSASVLMKTISTRLEVGRPKVSLDEFSAGQHGTPVIRVPCWLFPLYPPFFGHAAIETEVFSLPLIKLVEISQNRFT